MGAVMGKLFFSNLLDINYEDIKDMGEEYWKIVLPILKGEKMSARTAKNPVSKLLRQLADHNITDINTVSRIINVYGERLKAKFLPCKSRGTRCCCCLHREDFLSTDGPLISYAKLVFLAFQENDADFTDVLVSQGFIQVLPHDMEARFAKWNIDDFGLFVSDFDENTDENEEEEMEHGDEDEEVENGDEDEEIENWDEEVENWDEDDRLYEIFLKIVEDYVGETRSKSHKRGFRRIILFSMIVKALMMKKVLFHQDPAAVRNVDLGNAAARKAAAKRAASKHYVECLKIYFRAIPDPFFTNGELYDLLKLFFGHQLSDAVVKKWVEYYDKLFYPESRLPFSPRSLKHLCRCAIRKSLMENKSKPLPQLVEKLYVPLKLKCLLINDAE